MVKSHRRLLVVAAAALALSPVLAACGSPGASPSSTGNSGKAANIAYLTYTASDFSQAFMDGAKGVVAPDGGSVTMFAAEFDPQKQATQCEDAITSGRYNAIIIAPVDPSTAAACVTQAHTAGIPVATAETAIGGDPYSLTPQLPGVVAIAATPVSGQVAADVELIKSACGTANPCKVVAEVASPTDRWTTDVVNGVAASGSPIEVVAQIPTGYDPGEIAKALPDALTAHPDTNVVFAVSDQTAMAAVPVISAKGLTGQVKVLGLGGSTEGIAGVKDGTIFGTTGTWPIQTGAALATALAQSVRGETVTKPSVDMLTIDGPIIVTSANVGEFTPEWGSAH